jgi:tRNA G18 (ribose-2'-O)-methylase SpoU
MIITINDLYDPQLDAYRLVRERDLTGREGLFMAEGKVVLERLFTSKLAMTQSVLTTPERLQGLNIEALSKEVPIMCVPQDIMDQVAGFSIHRGYLALGRYTPPQSLADCLSKPRVRVLGLWGIANTDNMGGLMRNAAAFGIEAVLLDSNCCNPLYRKALRVSVGGALKVPHYRVDDILTSIREHDLVSFALSPEGQVTLEDVCPAERSALLFGAEGPGLPTEIMRASHTVRIDMKDGFDSLNVATTSGIVLYRFKNDA